MWKKSPPRPGDCAACTAGSGTPDNHAEDGLTEDERLDKLEKAMRHETTLQRQIDTAVKMLGKDAPQLYLQRAREEVLADTRTAAREYRDIAEDAVNVDLKLQDRLYRIRKAAERTEEAAPEPNSSSEICENEPAPLRWNPRQVREYLAPQYRYRPLAPHVRQRKRRKSTQPKNFAFFRPACLLNLHFCKNRGKLKSSNLILHSRQGCTVHP